MARNGWIMVTMILTLGLLLCNVEQTLAVVVYTVYNRQSTWNEAKAICRATNSSLLSMMNETEWQMWLAVLAKDSPAAGRSPSEYWFGLHSTNPSNFSELYWEQCQTAAYIEWHTARPSYVPDNYCLCFDTLKQIFNDIFLKLWFSRPCNDRIRFLCEVDSPCIHQPCDEFLISVSPPLDCSTSCSVLSTVGDITDLTNCRWQSLAVGSKTFCHVYKNPSVVAETDFNTICLKSILDEGLTQCGTAQGTVDLTTFNDDSTTPNSTCSSQQTSTGSSNTLCECSCPAQDDSTAQPLTLQEKIDIIKQELTIDKTQTSKSKRKLVSAPDERPSARGLGAFGLVILILVPVCVILIDIFSIRQQVNMFCGRKFKRLNDSIKTFTSDATMNSKDGNGNINKETAPYESRNLYPGKSPGRREEAREHAVNTDYQRRRKSSIFVLQPKTPLNPKARVTFKNILDVKYQASMIVSRIVADEVRRGKRQLTGKREYNMDGDTMGEVHRNKPLHERGENMSWLKMI